MQPQKTPLRGPGEQINNRYTVVQLIGHGASGEVYVVSDRESGEKDIALKYMKLDPEHKPALAHFKSEFDTMTHLNHPHIARVFDFEWDSDKQFYFFTSELVEGSDFVSSTKNFDIEQIEILLIQTLRALEYLHGHKIFHYDIKPQNVLIQDARGPSPSVKVIDFGLAHTGSLNKIVGTPSYIAPEIILGKPSDGRADLYSLGVLAYFALTGMNPFKGQTKEESFQNHLEVTPLSPSDINSGVPEYLSAIIMKLLEKDPDDRYSTPAAIIQDINFRSPRFYAIETPATLLSYVPWEGPFIGRSEHISTFKSWLKSTSEKKPEPALFWIRGELGTGKSRFLEECKNIAQLENFNVLIKTNIDNKFLSKLEKKPPGSIIMLDDLSTFLAQAGPDQLDFIKKALSDSPVVITSSNDDDTVKIIKTHFKHIKPQNLKIIGLEAFNLSELRNYIKTLTGLSEAPTWLTKSLFGSTEGNPLFLTETLKEMILKGLLFDQGGRWKKSTMEDLGIDLSNIDVPEIILFRLKEKFEGLTTNEAEILGLLSASYDPLDERVVAKILKKNIGKELKGLTASKMIAEKTNCSSIRFRNLVTKRAFYLWLPLLKRRAFHDLLAEHFNQFRNEEGEHEYHLQRGSDDNAARNNLLGYIYGQEETANTFDAIDEFLERFGDNLDDDVLDITLLRAKKLSALRSPSDILAIYEELLKRLPEETDSPAWHFKLRTAMALLYKKERKLDDASENFARARELAKLFDDPTAQVTIDNHFAGLELIKGNLDQAIQRYETTRSYEQKIDATLRKKINNNELGQAYFYKGNYSLAIDTLKDEIQHYNSIGNKSLMGRSLYALGEAYRQLRQFDKAETIFNQITMVAKETNDIERLYRAYNGLGNVLSDKGEFTDSVGYFERALDLAIHLDKHDDAVGLMINTAIINSNIGNLKKSFDTFQTTLSFLERKDFPVIMREAYLCRIHLELGELYRIQKAFERAEEHLKLALELAKKPESQFLLFWVLITEAKLAKDMKKSRSAKSFIKDAKRLVDSKDKKNLYEAVIRYKGNE